MGSIDDGVQIESTEGGAEEGSREDGEEVDLVLIVCKGKGDGRKEDTRFIKIYLLKKCFKNILFL